MIAGRKFLIVGSIILVVFALLKYTNLFSNLKENEILEAKLRKRTAKVLYKEKDLRFMGFGGSGVNEIKMSYMGFQKLGGPHNIDMARRLIVFAARTFLDEFNQDEKIRPYLVNYPFKIENIKISIFFYTEDVGDVPPSAIKVVSLTDGIIEYDVDKNDMLHTIYKESYGEALKIVEKGSH